MKKFCTLILSAAIIFALSGCDKQETSLSDSSENTETISTEISPENSSSTAENSSDIPEESSENISDSLPETSKEEEVLTAKIRYARPFSELRSIIPRRLKKVIGSLAIF